MSSNRVVIFHSPCLDGFTSAWIVWAFVDRNAEFVPAKYGDIPPNVVGKDVYVLDFSYPLESLDLIASAAQSLTIIDHHKTAEEDLRGWRGPLSTKVHFDMERSGAGMTWDILMGGQRPRLVDYVEDRDLWRFKLPCSKEINAYIGMTDQSWDEWDRLAMMLTSNFEAASEAGIALVKQDAHHITALKKHARLVTLLGHEVPIVNAPYFYTSDLLGELAKDWPFAVGWFVRADGHYQYSLRSRSDFDVSEIAKAFGGGGHKQAAGFTLNRRLEWPERSM